MGSYFTLELDTTSPVISLKCPSRTIPNNVVEIIITSNEPMDNYQEIYITDVTGKRNDLIFAQVDSCTFLGYVDFQTYPIGMCNLYIRLRDTVFNLSNIIEHQIYVGYINQNDNYDAYVGCVEVDKVVSLLERDTKVSYIDNEQNIAMTENLILTSVTERVIKVGVTEYGTNWRYS